MEANFSVFPLENANWQGIFYAPDGDPNIEAVEIAFNRLERSASYEYKGPSNLLFYRKSVNAEGLTVFQPVARIKMRTIKYVSDLILFFNPQTENGPYEIQYMLDSPSNFPEESIVFYNTMDLSFVGLVGDKSIEIPPGASAPVNVKKFFDAPTPIMVAIKSSEDLHLVIKNNISFAPDRRTLLVLRKPKSSTSLRVRTQRITEFVGKRAGADEERTE
jgi:hypothetical protein